MSDATRIAALEASLADQAAYIDELRRTLVSHDSALGSIRLTELEQKIAPPLPAPGVPSAQPGGGGSLAGVNTAYAPTVAMGAAGLFITDGAITVTNPGSTVIIDGSSNMFKIVATGTLTAYFPYGTYADNSASVSTSVAGGGTVPAVLMMCTLGGSSVRSLGSLLTFNGGSGVLEWAGLVEADLDGSGFVRITLHAHNFATDLVGYSVSCRYYVLKEAGI